MSKIIVILEPKNSNTLRPASLHAITFARTLSHLLGTNFSFILLGHNISELSNTVRGFGAEKVYVADAPSLACALAENHDSTLQRLLNELRATHIIGAATAFGKDLLPRLAAVLDSAYISDCIGFDAGTSTSVIWRRPICAGNAVAYCQSETPRTVISVRHAEFQAASSNGNLSPLVPVQAEPHEPAADRITLNSYQTIENPRPELSEARIVVSGGRALAGRFFEVLGPLADALGAALGATRAACDDGNAPGDFQVGQTGKIVAPDLYLAVGISGAIQHVAGMKGARIVVAINSDPQAPIVSVADYTLVGDLFCIVPELVDELRRRKIADQAS